MPKTAFENIEPFKRYSTQTEGGREGGRDGWMDILVIRIKGFTLNKPFKTHVHKGETSVPSVLPRFYERVDACVVNVFRTFCERF
jgi:hypothetical protein